jgi:hypothetical protein
MEEKSFITPSSLLVLLFAVVFFVDLVVQIFVEFLRRRRRRRRLLVLLVLRVQLDGLGRRVDGVFSSRNVALERHVQQRRVLSEI